MLRVGSNCKMFEPNAEPNVMTTVLTTELCRHSAYVQHKFTFSSRDYNCLKSIASGPGFFIFSCSKSSGARKRIGYLNILEIKG